MVNRAGFLGEFECRLDSKSRVVFPAGLKKQLPPEANGRFVINRGFEKHLVLYPINEWEVISAQLNRLNLFVKKNREFVRYFHRGATELVLDNSSRLLLPRRLLTYAGIKEELILLAYGHRIECWDRELYDTVLENEPENFAGLAEDIMGNVDKPEDDKGDSLPDFHDMPPMPPGQRH